MSETNPSRKVRSDSKLKTLPEERQADIVAYVREPHSLKETLAWLKEDGLETSIASLSEFISWWEVREQLRQNDAMALQVVEELKQNSSLTPQQIEDAGQAFFTSLALQQQNLKGWFLMQQVNLKKGQLALDNQKFLEATKSNLDKAMDAFAAQLQGNAKALKAYQHFRSEVDAILKPKS